MDGMMVSTRESRSQVISFVFPRHCIFLNTNFNFMNTNSMRCIESNCSVN
jgi:hypothetical protein